MKLAKDTKIKIQKQRDKRYKDKERILKTARDKRGLTYKGKHISVGADLSTETWQARKDWQDLQCDEKEKYAAKNPLSSKSVIQNRNRDKGFPKKQTNKQTKLKEFITTKPSL